jgi:hypothetical protein
MKRKRHPETCGKPSQDGETCKSPAGHIGPCQWARTPHVDFKRAAANDGGSLSD